ncbi:hypothetical protein [Paracoccus ravus]|uniref:hypothetical protein n=1 Tax=Paracoccus ravus TaxID=2447760 RepID=UPI00106EF969|nr:hypothetical protein [Paracoccus ravus]
MTGITASSAISRLGQRLGERRRRRSEGAHPAFTSDDLQNISDFEKLVEDTIRLLNLENDGLASGNVLRVAECYEAKSGLLRELTLKQPVIEPFLKEDVPELTRLRELLRQLAENLRRNGELLSAMAAASRSILSEIDHIRRRQSLDGIYDKSGQRRPGMGPRPNATGQKL